MSVPQDQSNTVPFGANEIRLTGPQWLAVAVIVMGVVLALPRLWVIWESVGFEPDYRVPYALSKDYWLYERWLDQVNDPSAVFVVGDSVVWGEYVSRDGTLSAFLNQQAPEAGPFVNAGVNGLFPLALEGLVRYYGSAIENHRVLLHCNLLWLTSPEADLSSEKEQRFNHPRLVPQFRPRIPCYRASLDDRLGVVMERSVGFLSWVNHLQNTYFDQQGLYEWTLADDGNYPPKYPNTYRFPLSAVNMTVPGEPNPDPDRGPSSGRHRAWSSTGEGTQNFDWVPLADSLQWGAFQRLVQLLVARGNEVLVVVGPLNRHIMAAENQTRFDQLQLEAQESLAGMAVRVVTPKLLSFELYGDASHPLTEGYERMATDLLDQAVVQEWLAVDSE